MLTVRMIDDLYASMDYILEYEENIIREAARLLGEDNPSDLFQETLLENIGALNIRSQSITPQLLAEAVSQSMNTDNRIYRAAGNDIPSTSENEIINAMVNAGAYTIMYIVSELLRTTISNATYQFEYEVGRYWESVISGQYTPEQAVRMAVKRYSENGMMSIRYPSGKVDYLDVAFRREIMTAITQRAGEIQLRNMEQMGAEYIETSAHSGARPEHQLWQGRVFRRIGETTEYPNFYTATGYGTVTGLCGVNCRHSFFPFYPELNERAYSDSKLREYNNRTVNYNGRRMSVYDASQDQRYLERGVRKWKREASALEAAGLDNAKANTKIREWQGRLRDFTGQTGLTRQYFREQVS